MGQAETPEKVLRQACVACAEASTVGVSQTLGSVSLCCSWPQPRTEYSGLRLLLDRSEC